MKKVPFFHISRSLEGSRMSHIGADDAFHAKFVEVETKESLGEINNILNNDLQHVNHTLDKPNLFASLSHRNEDFSLKCSWQGHDICDAYISPIITDMGQCWTFNAHASSPLFSKRTGEQNGLSIWINTEAYGQFQGYNDDAGIKVHLHPQNEIPQVADLGFAIPVGAHCLAFITYTKTHNLPNPSESCGEKKLKTYKVYSRAKCESECQSVFIADKCGCRPSHLPRMDDNFEACDFNSTINCVDKLIAEGIYHSENCTCVNSCQHNVYGTKLSYADITGRMLPNINITNLHTAVRTRLELKHRLQVDEFEKTVHVLDNLETATARLLTELEQLGDAQNNAHNPLNKLIAAENEFQNRLKSHIKMFFRTVSLHSDIYNMIERPIVQNCITVIQTACSDLQNLQNNILSLTKRDEVHAVLFPGEHALLSLQSAKDQVEKHSGTRPFFSLSDHVTSDWLSITVARP